MMGHCLRFSVLLWIASTFSWCPAEGQDAADAGQWSYHATETPVIYEVQVEADFGSKRFNKNATVTIAYEIEETKPGDLQITTGRIKPSSRWIYSVEHDYFNIGPFRISGYGTKSLLTPQGKVVEVKQPEWLCALPFDIGRLPFPELSDQQEWTIEETITLVRNARSPRHLQLLPLSPKISPTRDRLSLERSRGGLDASTSIAAVATTTRKASQASEQQIVIRESYALDGGGFEPAIFVAGEGTIQFSPQHGLVDSIDRNYAIKMKSTNREMVVPVHIKLTRLVGDALDTYQRAQQQEKDDQLKAEQQVAAMEAGLPDLNDRAAVTELIQQADDEQFEMLVRKMDKQQASQDTELARLLYVRHVSRAKLDYTTRKVIIRLDPSLEKTVALADKYALGSVDVALLGDVVGAETELKEDQLLFYQPYGSSWTYGRFYGTVRDVLVMKSRDREPKLIAVQREKCRLPMPNFWDPKTQDHP